MAVGFLAGVLPSGRLPLLALGFRQSNHGWVVSGLSDLGTKLKQDAAGTELLFVEPDTAFRIVCMLNPILILRPTRGYC